MVLFRSWSEIKLECRHTHTDASQVQSSHYNTATRDFVVHYLQNASDMQEYGLVKKSKNHHFMIPLSCWLAAVGN